jgi:glutamine amidotransferase
MREIEARGLRDVIVQAARTKPFLGICMGQQILFEHSEEGDTPCLGILPGKVLRFPADAMHDAQGQRLKVPHMGWNEVHQAQAHPMWSGIASGSRFYFVHSYYVEAGAPDLVAGFTLYPFAFTSAVARDNIFAVQFHPEKSQAAGLTLLANFVMWDGQSSPVACDSGTCL